MTEPAALSHQDASELWRPIPGYEHIYHASNLGRIKSIRRDKIMTPRVGNCGYMRVNLSAGGYSSTREVHRLVAEAFYGPNRDMCVDHIDDNKSNNHADNLRFVTPEMNTQKYHRNRNAFLNRYFGREVLED